MNEKRVMDRMHYFTELYTSLPRGGPGDSASTRKAFEMMNELPAEPHILDLGCGPGMQTVDLLERSGGTVVGLDLFPQMIARVERAVRQAGYAHRFEPVLQDMNAMNFAPASFDVVWSEGAIYILGFERGLGMVRELVKPGGYVAVSEVVWLKEDPPPDLIEFENTRLEGT